MQIHLLCIISIHSWIIPVISVIYVDSRLSWLVSSLFGLFLLLSLLYVQFRPCFPTFLSLLPSLLDFFCFSHSFMSNSDPVFLLSSLCFLLFWTFSASLTPLCPIQTLFSCFPLFASFSFGLFPLLSLLYVQFRPCFPAFLFLLSSLLDFFLFSCSIMSNSTCDSSIMSANQPELWSSLSLFLFSSPETFSLRVP